MSHMAIEPRCNVAASRRIKTPPAAPLAVRIVKILDELLKPFLREPAAAIAGSQASAFTLQLAKSAESGVYQIYSRSLVQVLPGNQPKRDDRGCFLRLYEMPEQKPPMMRQKARHPWPGGSYILWRWTAMDLDAPIRQATIHRRQTKWGLGNLHAAISVQLLIALSERFEVRFLFRA